MALAVDVDPVGLVRGRANSEDSSGVVDAYVNDRPYVASSFLSVAIARIFGTALGGRSERPELTLRPLALEARLSPVTLTHDDLARRLFEPLGYRVKTLPVDVPPDERVGVHQTIDIAATTTLQQLLTHIYVLIPVLDGEKHYWVGDEEVEKLFRFGSDWLAAHPEREFITRRYLKRAPRLARAAVSRLVMLDDALPSHALAPETRESSLERPLRLQDRRIAGVIEELREIGATSVADLGCGEGDLLVSLARESNISRIIGTDVSFRELERAKGRLDHTAMPESRRERIELFQSSALYADRRFSGLDAITLLEVIEHVDVSRVDVLVQTIFELARPRSVVLTTPNREYNVLFPALGTGDLRHSDHRFEWSRAEFRAWSQRVCARFGYSVKHKSIGDEDTVHGAPTQLAVFRCG